MLSSKLVSSVKNTVELIDICNRIHKGYVVDGYTVDDLPSDSVYENCLKDLRYVISGNLLSQLMKPQSNNNKKNNDEIMFMGSINKSETIIKIPNAIIMGKYDGVSVAMRFIKDEENPNDRTYKLVKAHTRGRDVSSTRVSTDQTEKMHFLLHNSGRIQFSEQMNFNQIDIRGEIVLKHKDPSIVSAAYVAGKVNGSFETFTEADKEICLVPFEVACVDGNMIPTQQEALAIIDKIVTTNTIVKPYVSADVVSTASDNIDFASIFENIVNHVGQPLDGIVYCADDWQYKTEFTVDYGKYAWKPTTDTIVRISSVEYTMGSTGELSPIIIFDTVTLDAKNYSRAKSAVSKLEKLIDAGLGVGCECVMSVKHNIHPHIDSVAVPSLKLFKIPINCPWCNAKLTHGHDKKSNALLHIVCTNESCPELRVQKFTKLIGDMSKLPNVKLTFIGKAGKPVRTKISETGLRQLIDTASNTLTLQNVLTKIPNLTSEFNKLSLADQLVVLGVGGPKAVEKLITKNKWRSIVDIPAEMNWLK
jgi:NAD-dependent DNA ligase